MTGRVEKWGRIGVDVVGIGFAVLVVLLWPPPWTFWSVSADNWTAFGTMLIALVALGVGVSEWRRWHRERDDRYEREIDQIESSFHQLASGCDVYDEPKPGEATPWSFRVENKSDRTFRGMQILVQVRKPKPLLVPELLAMQKWMIGNKYLPAGYDLDLLNVPAVKPSDHRSVRTLPTDSVRLAWLVIPDQDRLRRRPRYRMLGTID